MRRARIVARILAASSAVFIAAAGGADEKAAPEVHGINPANMDPSVAACQDFNLYGNGGWIKANAVPSDQSEWDSFTILDLQNRENLHKVLENVSKASNAPATDDQKIGDFYFTCMDEAAVEAQGAAPLQKQFDAIAKIESRADLPAEIARLQLHNVNAVFASARIRTARTRAKSSPAPTRAASACPTATTTRRPTTSRRRSATSTSPTSRRCSTLLGDDAGEGRGERENRPRVRDAARRSLDDPRRAPRSGQDVPPDERRRGSPKLTPNFSWTAYLQEIGASSDRRDQRRAAEVLRGASTRSSRRRRSPTGRRTCAGS